MKPRRRILTTSAIALGMALPLLAAERLAVRTGLWENVSTLQVTGVTLPKEQLERMQPAQRAQLEEMLRQMGVGQPRTDTGQSCITEEDLTGNAFRDSLEEAGQDCDYQQVTATAKKQEWTFQCRTEGVTTNGRLVLDVLSNTRVKGSMEATLPQGRMDMTFDATWKAASCGSVE